MRKYTPSEIRQMQKEAVNRVKNLKNIEKETAQNFNKVCRLTENPAKKNENIEDNAPVLDEKPNFSINNMIRSMINDPERALILVLILIFMSENENPSITLALLYILM